MHPMKSIQITVRRYRCDYCQCLRSSAASCRKHEVHCFKREDRIPHEGEMSDFSGGEEEVVWDWPGSGKIFHEGKWEDVPDWIEARTLMAMQPRDRISKLFDPTPILPADFEPAF